MSLKFRRILQAGKEKTVFREELRTVHKSPFPGGLWSSGDISGPIPSTFYKEMATWLTHAPGVDEVGQGEEGPPALVWRAKMSL